MTLLKSISLSNIRRFAAEVTVPVSAQATIILAPNGTGKTALFEAIELALTGAVARLEDDLYALVRDGEQRAVVSLDFGDFRPQANVTASEGLVKWSGPSPIYGKTNPSDIGYLLRLTHLLDQRDRHWFTQEDPSTAGDQLDRLPMGASAQQARGVLTGLKGAMTKTATDREQAVAKANVAKQAWNELLGRREEALARVGGEWRSLEELARALQLHTVEKISGESLEGLEAAQTVCASNNNTHLEGLRRKFAALEQLEPICAEFASTVAEVAKLDESKKQFFQAQVQAQLSRDGVVSKVADATAAHIEAELGFRRLKDERVKVEETQRLRHRIQEETAGLATARQTLNLNVDARVAASNELKLAQDIDVAHHLWATAHSEWQGKVHELEEATRIWTQWKADTEQFQALAELISGLKQDVSEQYQAQEDRERERVQAFQEAAVLKEQLQNLQQSSDSVRAAVATIAADLGAERGDCPVCGVNHGVVDLRRRMADQLRAVDPVLRDLAERERQSREFAAQSERLKNEAAQKHSQSVEKLNSATQNQGALWGRLDAARGLALFGGAGLDAAKLGLEEHQKDLDVRRKELDDRFQRLATRPTTEKLIQLHEGATGASTRENEAAQTLRKREELVSNLQQELELSLISAESRRPLEVLLQELTKQEALVDQKQANRRQLEAQAETEEAKLRQSIELFGSAHLNWQRAEGRKGAILERWLSLQLSGEPNQSVLSKELEAVALRISAAKDASNELNQIRQDIARWRGALEYRRLQSEIDKQKGEQSEVEHGALLSQHVELATTELNRVIESKATVETFTAALNNEVEQIHSRMRDIEPLWQSLLGRIVREPRFIQTGLEYLRRRNKPHANVLVPVGGGRDAPAFKVASEAQKADLQLSFLLSMAQAHQWSPWKALLLDDPTQHHDLVHASAVFDVLRDYIVEQGFQTIVTTHDAVQAHFFARKLENDGVDVKMLTLAPRAGGVRVQPIGMNA